MEPSTRESTVALRQLAANEFALSGSMSGPAWTRYELRVKADRDRQWLRKEAEDRASTYGSIRICQEILGLPQTTRDEYSRMPYYEADELLEKLKSMAKNQFNPPSPELPEQEPVTQAVQK